MATPAFATTIGFDLTGAGGLLGSSFDFTEDGLTLTVAAFTINTNTSPVGSTPAGLVQTGFGLGVDSGPGIFIDNPISIDELIFNFTEALVISFDVDVTLDSIDLFTIDPGDNALIRVLGGGPTFITALGSGVNTITGPITLPAGSQVAIGAPIGGAAILDNAFTLSGLTATTSDDPDPPPTVPSPAAAGAGLVLLAGLTLRRQR
ncbi:hypothetical protein [Mucisphaera sp.]|uniref:hypothetical protein n=1 Tax=Mucisphaera sp. TaxID=2913024 RepID=UPI003D13C57F